MKELRNIPVLLLILLVSACGQKAEIQSKSDILDIIENVNSYWQTSNPDPGWAFWHNAAYHTGNIEVFFLTGDEKFLSYSIDWADRNEWKGAKSDDITEWKYGYGEKDDYVLFGDWQTCFQTYIDLYNIEPADYKIARAIEVMEYQMSTPNNDYWWWVDGLYMVMPVMTKLYKLTGEQLYLDKLYEYYEYAKSIMYDEETSLFYRDAKYIYPQHKSANGMKDFWARGDGWLFAALVKIILDLPDSYEPKQMFIQQYAAMAKTLIELQQPEGYWTRSMLDPEHAPGAETSGTAFFTYGFLWGINNGYLDAETYLPVAMKGWKYLTTVALQPSGRIGYVQPIGERAIPGQIVDENSTADFGVGAFLLAACEMYRFVEEN